MYDVIMCLKKFYKKHAPNKVKLCTKNMFSLLRNFPAFILQANLAVAFALKFRGNEYYLFKQLAKKYGAWPDFNYER